MLEVHRDLQEYRDSWGREDLQELRAFKDSRDCKDLLDQYLLTLHRQVLPVSLAHRETLDLQVLLDHKEFKDHRDYRAHKDCRVLRVLQVQLEHRVYREFREKWALQD